MLVAAGHWCRAACGTDDLRQVFQLSTNTVSQTAWSSLGYAVRVKSAESMAGTAARIAGGSLAASAGMRKLVAALIASLFMRASASPAGAGNLPRAKRIPGVGDLFVLRAGGGKIDRVRAGVFELVLRRPASAVTVFTDRPRRVA